MFPLWQGPGEKREEKLKRLKAYVLQEYVLEMAVEGKGRMLVTLKFLKFQVLYLDIPSINAGTRHSTNVLKAQLHIPNQTRALEGKVHGVCREKKIHTRNDPRERERGKHQLPGRWAFSTFPLKRKKFFKPRGLPVRSRARAQRRLQPWEGSGSRSPKPPAEQARGTKETLLALQITVCISRTTYQRPYLSPWLSHPMEMALMVAQTRKGKSVV
ncbi:PREDICTED: uncharacterized protein LOC105545484 [Mandrillus leucophaeus]|nr:PREDICTED: uncharacterized protein LOC105545484 [Mandrillus leucophaeus]